ncbi:hypothetical protein CU098_002208, partial [Rhizopus stolonifer]
RGIPLVLTTNASKISRHSPPMNRKRRAPDFLISSLKSETSLLEAYDSFSSECFNGVFSRREYFVPGQNISTIDINSDEHVPLKSRKITTTKSNREKYAVKKKAASLPSTPQLLSLQEYPQPYLQKQTQPYLQIYPQSYAQPYPPPPYPIMFANPQLYSPYQISQHDPSGVPPLIYYADATQNSAPMTFMPAQPQGCVENTSVPSINNIPVLSDQSIISSPSSMGLNEPIKSKEDDIPFKENITQQQTIVHEQHTSPPLATQEQDETCLTEETLDPSNKENLSKHILTETPSLTKQNPAPLNNENTNPVENPNPVQQQQRSIKKDTTNKRVTRQSSERKAATTESLEEVKKESRYPERRTRAQTAAMAANKDTSLVVNTRRTRSSKEKCLDIPKAKVTRAATSKKSKVSKVPKSTKVTKTTMTTRASRSRKPVVEELEESKLKEILDMVKPEASFGMEPKEEVLKMEESTVESLKPEDHSVMEPKTDDLKMKEMMVDSLHPEAPFDMEPKENDLEMEETMVDSLQLKKEEPLEAAESSDEKNTMGVLSSEFTNSEPNKKETNALKSDPKAIEIMPNDFKQEQEIELLKENVQVEVTINVVSKESQEDTTVVLGDTEKVVEPVSDDAKEAELKDNILEPSFESPNESIADDNASGENAAKTKFEDETVFMESLLSDEMALSALDDPFPMNFNEENIIDDTVGRLSQNNGISTGNLVTDRSYEQLQQKYGSKQNKKAAEGSNSQEECTLDSPKAVQTKEGNVDLDSERIKRIQSEIDLINLQFPDLKNSFTLLDRVGRGCKVYKALDLFYSKSISTHPPDKPDDSSDSRNELVAIKLIHGISSPRRVANEIKCLAELRNEDVTYLVLPYIEFDHFEDIYSTMCLLDLKHYISQLFIGLKGVHAKGIIHRDIKPGNFMYNNRTKIGYLGDFGLAQRTTHPEVHRPGQLTAKVDPSYSLPEDGPPGYIMNDTRRPIQVDRSGTRSFRAPEIYLNSPRQTTGVILLSFLTNIYPYFDAEDSAAGIVELMTTFGTKQVNSFANFYDES